MRSDGGKGGKQRGDEVREKRRSSASCADDMTAIVCALGHETPFAERGRRSAFSYSPIFMYLLTTVTGSDVLKAASTARVRESSTLIVPLAPPQ